MEDVSLREYLDKLGADASEEFILTASSVRLVLLYLTLFVFAVLSGLLTFPLPVSSVTAQAWMAVLILLVGLSGNLVNFSLSLVMLIRRFGTEACRQAGGSSLQRYAGLSLGCALLVFWLAVVFDSWMHEGAVHVYRLVEAPLFPYESGATLVFIMFNIALLIGVLRLGLRTTTAYLKTITGNAPI